MFNYWPGGTLPDGGFANDHGDCQRTNKGDPHLVVASNMVPRADPRKRATLAPWGKTADSMIGKKVANKKHR